MTPPKAIAVVVLLAVLLPLVLVAGALSWLRLRWRMWRVGQELRAIEDAAYRERYGTRG